MIKISKFFTVKFAFTLAEVLITLGIIGIVAALTIPVLMREYQKIQYIAQLKKVYSEFSQGMKAYMASKDCTTLECTGLFDGDHLDGTWVPRVESEIKTVFKIAQSCPFPNTDCEHKLKYLKGNGTYTLFNGNGGYTFVGADGFMVGITDGTTGNCAGYSSTTSSSKLKNYCAIVMVDLNGFGTPNILGRDGWRFFIGNDGNLYPSYGMEDAKAQSNSDTTWASSAYYWNSSGFSFYCGTGGSSDIANNTTGLGCSARVMEEGWDITY